MRLRYRICFVGLLVVVAAALLWARRSREPSYQGKRFSQWMNVLVLQADDSEDAPYKQATEAIRHIGTNALPFLLAEMQYKESPFHKALAWLDAKQNVINFDFTPEGAHRNRAVLAFKALGPAAKPALSTLVELLNNPDTCSEAAEALAWIGPESLPPLSTALTNQNSDVRFSALYALGSMQAQAEVAVPEIISCLKDPDPAVRREAASSLGRIHKRGDLAIPALSGCLQDQGAVMRRRAVNALAAFGPEAKPAVPALLNLLGDPEEKIRSAATNALKKIDPEAAAKAGIQ